MTCSSTITCLDPVLANIFMYHFEEKQLMNSRLWRRSVTFAQICENTFTMFDSKGNADELTSFLNSRHDSIKFTLNLIELEEDYM